MSTIPFLIKFAKGAHQDTSEDESGNKQLPPTYGAVTPQPPATIFTKVQNETTDDT